MKKTAIIILVLLGIQNIGFSQSLEEYFRIAADNNPELKASSTDYLAALEKVPQVGSLPDPELNMGFFLSPMEFAMGNQTGEFQLMQMFPWFGTLEARKDEADKMAWVSYEAVQDLRNRLFFNVKNVWYQMYRIEEEIRITQENLEILEQYERLTLNRFQSPAMGSGSSGAAMTDVLRVKMEIKELESSLALLMDSRMPLQAEFNQLLNRDINESIAVPDSLSDTSLSVERLVLLDSIIRNNPMLKMLDAEDEVYDAQKRMARLEGRPMMGAGVSYMAFSPRKENGMTMGGHDMVMPMVSLTIPIYRKKYNAMKREAELKQTAVRQRRENTVNELSTQWAVTLRDLDNAIRVSGLYREQVSLAEQTLNLLMTSYSTGGGQFEEVLRVQQQLLDYQLKLISAIVDQHTSMAALENLAAINRIGQ